MGLWLIEGNFRKQAFDLWNCGKLQSCGESKAHSSCENVVTCCAGWQNIYLCGACWKQAPPRSQRHSAGAETAQAAVGRTLLAFLAPQRKKKNSTNLGTLCLHFRQFWFIWRFLWHHCGNHGPVWGRYVSTCFFFFGILEKICRKDNHCGNLSWNAGPTN